MDKALILWPRRSSFGLGRVVQNGNDVAAALPSAGKEVALAPTARPGRRRNRISMAL